MYAVCLPLVPESSGRLGTLLALGSIADVYRGLVSMIKCLSC